jgi:hypothetical protein
MCALIDARRRVKKSKIGHCARWDSAAAPSIPHPRIGDAMAEPVKVEAPRPDPNEKLVKVFDSEDESEALVVKGLLDSADIESDLTSAAFIQDMFPGLGGLVILVREEDADAAKRLIADYKRPTSDEEETAEIEAIEDPPQQA